MNLALKRNRNALTPFRTELEDLMGRFLDAPTSVFESNLPEVFRRPGFPPVNVAETEKSWIVSLDLPGLDEKDITVQLMGNQLVVSGERKWEAEKKDKEYHRTESQYGSFQRAIELPDNARRQPDALTASYKRGILEIVVPKVEPTPAAKIPIRAG
jgi:HSP20 family protein